MIDELPPGPFFDAIREWNAMARANRAKYPDLPEGFIPISKETADAFNEALREAESQT